MKHSLRDLPIDGNHFFTGKMLGHFTERIKNLSPQSKALWGTMAVDQMLHHLNLACGNSSGHFNLKDETSFLSRTVFKWLIVDLLPHMPKGLRRPSGLRIPVSSYYDFEQERNLLLKIITAAITSTSATEWSEHIAFGYLTHRQWGKLLYKHIDYHLKQFNV